jgi:hypothetical protein
MTAWAWVPVGALGIVTACSARVVTDPPSGDGGAAEGGGGTGGSPVPAESVCHQWCEANTPDCGDIDACVAHCLEKASYMGSCAPAFEALLACKIDSEPIDPPDCGPTEPATGCNAEGALAQCIYPAGTCTEGGCVAGSSEVDPATRCDYSCGGTIYTATCEYVGADSFPLECACQVDGETVGTCQAVSGLGLARFGCCSAHFADSE